MDEAQREVRKTVYPKVEDKSISHKKLRHFPVQMSQNGETTRRLQNSKTSKPNMKQALKRQHKFKPIKKLNMEHQNLLAEEKHVCEILHFASPNK